MPQGEPLDVNAPNKAQIRAAWMATETSLDILEDLSAFLCSGNYIPRDLNDSDFVFAPKGDNLAGELTTDRAAEDTRPFPSRTRTSKPSRARPYTC